MKYLVLVLMALGLTACGSGSKTYSTYEENITIEEPYVVPDGMAIIVDHTEGSSVGIDYDNNQYVIDCGGVCGDISIGVPAQ